MEISAALAVDLNDLSAALDQPGAGLEAILRTFASDARAAVRSFLGLTMRIATDGGPFSFTVLEPPAAKETVVSSLLLPLPLLSPVEVGSEVVLYAATPGAFVDLAADLAFALDIDATALPLDEHLDLPDRNLPTGLSDMAVVNRAIGVLIDRGHTAEQAHAELHRSFGRGSNIVAAAYLVIASIAHPPAEPV